MMARCELRHKPGAIACKDGRFVATRFSSPPGPWVVSEICPMCLKRSEHDGGLTIEGAADKIQELHAACCPSPMARIDDALAKLEDPGETAEQKQWTLDQVLRALLGREYGRWIQDWEAAEGRPWPVGVDEPDTMGCVSVSSPLDPPPS